MECLARFTPPHGPLTPDVLAAERDHWSRLSEELVLVATGPEMRG